MSLSGWSRVATGFKLVAETAAKQAALEATTGATRTAQHGFEVAASARAAAEASHQWRQEQPPNHGQFQQSPPIAQNLHGFVSGAADVPSITSSPEPVGGTVTNEQASQISQILPSSSSSPPQPLSQPPTQPQSQPQQSEATALLDNLVASENQIRSSPVAAADADAPIGNTSDSAALQQELHRLQEGRAVPTSRAARAMGFASLGFGLAMGTASEGLSRIFGSSSTGSVYANDANADRLSATLCRMRGAALKMGQMLSIQDESLLPPALSRALQQVRQGADAMPKYQLVKQMEQQLGKDWREKFETFDDSPFAAASIGQVHRATIREPNGNIRNVVVKVQYPGVANSIESDLNNLSMLVTLSGLAPKGLFIENVIRVGQEELKVECDYQKEMSNQHYIKKLVEADPVLQENRFVVPEVIESLTTDQIITSDYRPGGTIDKVAHLDQEERNRIARTIMYLTMKELFVWRFMQTDPNWGNFLYDVGSRTTSLIDFGATREYSKDFVDGYLRIVWASANQDEETLMAQSHRMEFLTGGENEEMLHAHKMSGYTVGEPFASDEPFDFCGSNISTRMGEHTSVFLKHRLTAPPEEVYTLHRKLAGAYMLCIKLGAVIQSRDMLQDIVANHVFEDGLEHPLKGR